MNTKKIIKLLEEAVREEENKLNNCGFYKNKIIELNNKVFLLKEEKEKVVDKYNKLVIETEKLADDNIAFLKEMKANGEKINWDNVDCYKKIKIKLFDAIEEIEYYKQYQEKYNKIKGDLYDITGCC